MVHAKKGSIKHILERGLLLKKGKSINCIQGQRERRSLEKEGSRIPCVRPAERSRWRGLERTALLRGRSRATS
jgi:hypothetical protein